MHRVGSLGCRRVLRVALYWSPSYQRGHSGLSATSSRRGRARRMRGRGGNVILIWANLGIPVTGHESCVASSLRVAPSAIRRRNHGLARRLDMTEIESTHVGQTGVEENQMWIVTAQDLKRLLSRVRPQHGKALAIERILDAPSDGPLVFHYQNALPSHVRSQPRHTRRASRAGHHVPPLRLRQLSGHPAMVTDHDRYNHLSP